MLCCFLGHRDVSSRICKMLEEVIERMITEEGVTSFLVGNQGNFDRMVLNVLRRSKMNHSHIIYSVVFAYMPTEKKEPSIYLEGETLIPEGIEKIHPKYAISWRDKWMVEKADIVVAYVTHSWGGAAKYLKFAEKKKKAVINLAITT